MAGSADNFYLDTQKMTEKVNKLANFKGEVDHFNETVEHTVTHPWGYLLTPFINEGKDSAKNELRKGIEQISETLKTIDKSLTLYCEETLEYDQLKVTRK